ncbi:MULTISPECIES: PspC domain-containing protein [Nocardiopsis]|uniref:PspC domain-containing protein n=1 Tax=Nocardiopsis lambiniae TaxID=3075539 RepID=A0ABU2M331_9ACTN|nr:MULTISPECIES: PspC domain-containing protein [unclassified Nocardiopsis]MDE3725022.1 PspC domain-containing protein [Nocardiopsis sp. N85]MDT0327049.1 PspC domain-containing protein [Nocardiopsis sp. DSM 44743]
MNDELQGKRFRRSDDNRFLAGVCGGIADYLGVDANIVRLVFVALTLLGFSGVFVYILAWLIMPGEHEQHSLLEQIIRNFQGKPSRD